MFDSILLEYAVRSTSRCASGVAEEQQLAEPRVAAAELAW